MCVKFKLQKKLVSIKILNLRILDDFATEIMFFTLEDNISGLTPFGIIPYDIIIICKINFPFFFFVAFPFGLPKFPASTKR